MQFLDLLGIKMALRPNEMRTLWLFVKDVHSTYNYVIQPFLFNSSMRRFGR